MSKRQAARQHSGKVCSSAGVEPPGAAPPLLLPCSVFHQAASPTVLGGLGLHFPSPHTMELSPRSPLTTKLGREGRRGEGRAAHTDGRPPTLRDPQSLNLQSLPTQFFSPHSFSSPLVFNSFFFHLSTTSPICFTLGPKLFQSLPLPLPSKASR